MLKSQSWILFAISCYGQQASGQFCDSACLSEVAGAKSYAASLHESTNQDVERLLQRIVDSERKLKSYETILDRVVLLEFALLNNISRLEKRIGDDVNYVLTEIEKVRVRVEVWDGNHNHNQNHQPTDNRYVEDLRYQVSNMDKNLRGNVTQLSNQVRNEIVGLSSVLTDNIGRVNRDVNSRIDKVIASIPNRGVGNGNGGGNGNGNGGGNRKAMDVYYNLTRRIDNLESGKIYTLSADNDIWRLNFKIVNATFASLKKNNYLNGG